MSHAPQFLVLATAGWLTGHQQDLIDYLREEGRVLREQLGCKRLRLTDEQRRRLAVRGQSLGRKALGEVAGIVTPDTYQNRYLLKSRPPVLIAGFVPAHRFFV